jgi:hypothetical protein
MLRLFERNEDTHRPPSEAQKVIAGLILGFGVLEMAAATIVGNSYMFATGASLAASSATSLDPEQIWGFAPRGKLYFIALLLAVFGIAVVVVSVLDVETEVALAYAALALAVAIYKILKVSNHRAAFSPPWESRRTRT